MVLPSGYLRDKYSKLYGYATLSGIVFLNKNDKFPRLTEEEERFHAALIGRTTFGLLQTVFSNLYLDVERISYLGSILGDLYGPTEVAVRTEPNDFDVIMVGQDTDDALNPKISIDARNLIQKNVDTMCFHSRTIHEATA